MILIPKTEGEAISSESGYNFFMAPSFGKNIKKKKEAKATFFLTLEGNMTHNRLECN